MLRFIVGYTVEGLLCWVSGCFLFALINLVGPKKHHHGGQENNNNLGAPEHATRLLLTARGAVCARSNVVVLFVRGIYRKINRPVDRPGRFESLF